MGRIDPPQNLRGPGTVVSGKLILGIAAVLIIALGSYELGRRSSAPRAPQTSAVVEPPQATAPPKTAATATPVSQSTEELLAASERLRPSPREERAAAEVTVPRPEPAPATQPPRTETPDLPETLHDKMARCLSFQVENDEIHYGGYSPLALPVKVTVSNACSFSFEGPDVSVEVRAIPVHGEGTIVRVVGKFQERIPSRGRSETQMIIACPRCEEVAHRFEARLVP